MAVIKFIENHINYDPIRRAQDFIVCTVEVCGCVCACACVCICVEKIIYFLLKKTHVIAE